MTGLKRFLVSFVSLMLCFFLQLVILPGIPGVRTVPNLLLVETVSLGFLYGKASGLAAGTAAGLLFGVLGSGIPGFYTLIFAVLGYLNGMLSEKIESEMILILFVLFAINEAVFHTYVFLLAFLIRKQFAFGSYLKNIVMPEMLLSLIAFLVLYGILIFLSKRWDLRVNKGEIKIV